ncbi:MAG: YetF domain-containing protein [Caldimonas sp.]
MDWTWLVEFKVPAWELILRGSAMYWFLFLIFRLVLRRDVGAIGVADVLLVVLVADASQNAMAGGYTSVAEGAVLVSTLVAWNLLLDWMAYRFPWASRLVEPRPLLLIRRGRVQHKHLRAEMITLAELRGHLRQHGVESFAEVRSAWFESDGQFSVLKFDGAADEPPAKRSPYP